MHKTRIKYIVRSAIAVVIVAVPSAIVSVRLISAVKMSFVGKVLVIGFLLTTICYFIYIFVKGYKKLDEYDLNSPYAAPWPKKK